LGFNFQFYGRVYSQIYVNTNGQVLFSEASASNSPEPIPTPGGAADNYAACFWSDLIVTAGSEGVWLETSGSPGTRQTVITYQLRHFEDQPTPPMLFQMILFEGNNRIKCQYAHVPESDALSGGRRSTIGLETLDGTSGLEYYFDPDIPGNIGPLEDRLALLFVPGGLTPAFTASRKWVTPGMHPGNAVTYTIAITNNSVTPGGATTLVDPIPAGTTYVPGSAQVQGGGVVNGNNSTVNWSGSIAAGQTVTITFAVTLPGSGLITNTATINDAQAVGPISRQAVTPVQPATGQGVGPRPYIYRDSYAPGISYTWVPTTGASSMMAINVGDLDNGYGDVPLGFVFRFDGRDYTHAFASTDGLVMFNDLGDNINQNFPIPSLGVVDNFATCFWDDQKIANLGPEGIWYETFGNAPNRTTVITIVLEDGIVPGAPHQYQMILAETGGVIKCQYANADGVGGDGSSATIGLEGRYGNTGIQYFTERNTPPHIGPVESGLAIVFRPAVQLFLPLLER
jgi:uncharacterized repeat protein (TIGR01451 family)